MKRARYIVVIIAFIALGLVGETFSQFEEQCPHIEPMLAQRDRRSRMPSRSVKEQLIKLCIKESKKEFQKLVKRTEEIAKLSDEIKASFDENQALSEEDQEKLEKVQDLVKKVRKDLRASKDKKDTKRPESAVEAVIQLQSAASSLLAEIKKTTRHTVSLVAIKSSNALVKIVKFLRFGN